MNFCFCIHEGHCQDIANMCVSALKSPATGDRHKCILKEQEKNKLF